MSEGPCGFLERVAAGAFGGGGEGVVNEGGRLALPVEMAWMMMMMKVEMSCRL